MSRERQATLYALAAVALWSTVATGFKLGLRELEPVQLLFLGSLVASLIFAGAALAQGWPRHGLLVGEAMAFGLVNPVLYYLVLFEAYDRLPAHIAQPLNYTWAISLAILAVPLLGQRLSWRGWSGILVSYAGVLVLLSGSWQINGSPLDGLGIALALASTILWALYWLMNARAQTPPEALMASSFLFATPILAILCATGPGLPELTVQTLGYASWIGAAEMGIAFLCWQRALRLTSNVGRIGQLIFVSPFVSLLIIGSVLNEPIGVQAWLGLSVIVIGVWLTQHDTQEKPQNL